MGSIDLDTLGFSVGSIHTLDVFHAERYCCESNFRVTTSICTDLCPGSHCRASEIPCDLRPTGMF